VKSLQTSVRDYLTMRRALGFKLQRHEAHLLDFVAYMQRHRARRITGEWMVRWVRENPSTDPSYQGLRFAAVRSFAIYHSTVDPRTEVPPADLMPRTQGRDRFYLYSDEEIQRLLAETLKPRVGAASISRWVRYTLYGLLSVTGLRIGEALRLNVTDVDLDQGILTIRDSKFGKSRLVPLHPSTRTALYAICNDALTTFVGATLSRFLYLATALACSTTMLGSLWCACRGRLDCVAPRIGAGRGCMISGTGQL